MLGILIAIVSAIFMSGMYILLKRSYEELNPSVAFFFDMLFGLILWIPIGFIFGARLSEIPQVLIYAVISAILSEAFVFYALSKGNLSIATTLISTYPIYTLLFSFLINNEILNIYQLIFIILTILGIILTCIGKDIKIKSFINPLTIIPILASIAIGISDTLTKKIINDTSSFSFLVAIALVQIPVSFIYLKITKHRIKDIFKEIKIKKETYKYGIIGSLLNVIATGLLLISFNYAMASIASPLTAMYTPLVLLYAFIFLKEKISKINIVGIFLALIGTFGIFILGF